jgi:hypothetical protein
MRCAGHFIARLVVALGLLLNGLGPALADMGGQRGDSMAMPMTMTPGMDMGSPHGAPARHMPCGGMDCGCCIGGACAMPVVLQAEQAIASAATSGKIHRRDAFLAGITFPPDIRPPIARA